MSTFVLVHGMSHGGWAWSALAKRLERAGHRVVAPDLPGHGRRAHERARATVDRYAAAVADAMMLAGAHDAVRWMSDLPPGDARVVDALARLTPQPFTPWVERQDLRRFLALRMPCTYIRCLRDQAVTPARAAEYAARLGVRPIDMDCAHTPMLSAPDALAKILESV